MSHVIINFSMMGPSPLIDDNHDLLPTAGVIPRFVHDLFSKLQIENNNTSFNNISKCLSPTPGRQSYSATVELSYYEIYNEKIHDLLRNDTAEKLNLRLREHPTKGPIIENLSAFAVDNFHSVMVS